MYCTGKVIIHKAKQPALFAYCEEMSRKANSLGNAALFRLRQHFTGRTKDVLTANEQEVADEITLVVNMTGRQAPKALINYPFLEKLMRLTENPDFFSGLPMQTAQAVLKERIRDMKGWFAAIRQYKKDPTSFTGRPAIPGYWKRGGMHSFSLTNQDCRIKSEPGGVFLKLPLTAERVRIGQLPENSRLKEVKVVPYYDCFTILYTYECEHPYTDRTDLVYAAGIDFGIENTVALVTSEGHSLLVKGGALKAANQWFNRQKAFYASELTKGRPTIRAPKSRMLDALSRNRAQFLHDTFHQISARIISYCLKYRIGTLVLGQTKGWKQRVRMGSQNDQGFASIPFDILRRMIRYKAERAGITVIIQEESYTSQASFADSDYIPVYGRDDERACFSGKRVKRGLYRCSDGTIVNADLNAAANILKKAKQDAFEGRTDITFLKNPEVWYYACLHRSDPLKGTAAA